MEMTLSEKGVFSTKTATGLLNFYNCKLFGLRAGDEHHSLMVEQFQFCVSSDDEYLEFVGHSSKTYQGELQHQKLLAKNIKIIIFCS